MSLRLFLFAILLLTSCASPPAQEPWWSFNRGSGLGPDPTTAQTSVWALAPIAGIGTLLMLIAVALWFLGDKKMSLPAFAVGISLNILTAVLVGVLKHAWSPWVIFLLALICAAWTIFGGGWRAWHFHRRKSGKMVWPWTPHRHDEHGELLESYDELEPT